MSEKQANREDTKTRRSPEERRYRATKRVMTQGELEMVRHTHMATLATEARDRRKFRLARLYAGHARHWLARWWDLVEAECAPWPK